MKTKQPQKRATLPRVKCMYNLDPKVAEKIRDGAKIRGISLSAFVSLAVEGVK